MSRFDYLTPETVQEAISMYLDKPEQTSMYMAGGTDALIKIKEGIISPNRIISLKHIKEHNTIEINSATGNLIIGSFVTHRTLEMSELIQQKYKIIHDSVKNIGSIQIRNIATIGGNLINAAPSADGTIPLIALDSFVNLYGKNGKRSIKLIDVFLAPGSTILKPDEILTDIIVPKQDFITEGAYKKFTRRAAMELPIVGIAVSLSLDKKTHSCKKARICLGVAAPTPRRALKAEKLLTNNIITENLLEQAGILAATESKVRDSIRGQAWHRKELISVFVKRMGLLTLRRIEAYKSYHK